MFPANCGEKIATPSSISQLYESYKYMCISCRKIQKSLLRDICMRNLLLSALKKYFSRALVVSS